MNMMKREMAVIIKGLSQIYRDEKHNTCNQDILHGISTRKKRLVNSKP
jgi:hypothetical protein